MYVPDIKMCTKRLWLVFSRIDLCLFNIACLTEVKFMQEKIAVFILSVCRVLA